MAKYDDKTIVSMLSEPGNERRAFKIIVDRYSEPLYWKIRRIVIEHDDANDILQNTFLKAWQALGTFHAKSKLSTWLYRIAINESLDFLRRAKNRGAAYDDGSLAEHLMADDYFDGSRAQAVLQEAIAGLPDVQRTVFTLRYYDEMKYSDISRMLNTTEGALKASYHIAVKKISEYVLNHYTE